MKQVEWISSETRMIPGIGEGAIGNVLNMPTDIADSFIKQGLVKAVKKVVVKKSVNKEENE